MKTIILLIAGLLLFTTPIYSQTAVDFTLTDCNGVSQHLYSLLDQGKVVTLIYEHQCPSCTQGSKNVATVINNFYSADTDIIVMYLDNGGYNCNDILGWMTTNNLVQGPYIAYSNSGTSPYGSGMPVIVVAACNTHTTFLTSLGPSDTNTIHNAIRTAIDCGAGGMVRISPSKPDFTIYPNPVRDGKFTVDFRSNTKKAAKAAILDLTGNERKTDIDLNSSEKDRKSQVSVADLDEGIYFFRVDTGEGIIAKKFTIAK